MSWGSDYYDPDDFLFDYDLPFGVYDDYDDEYYYDEQDRLVAEQLEAVRQHSQTIANYLCLFDDDGETPRVNKSIVELPIKRKYWGENDQWFIPPF